MTHSTNKKVTRIRVRFASGPSRTFTIPPEPLLARERTAKHGAPMEFRHPAILEILTNVVGVEYE